MPSRVYALPPDTSKGERLPVGKVYTHTGQELPSLTRVEFDKDADRGMASLTMLLRTKDNELVLDPEKNSPVTVKFRAWVQMVPKGKQPISVAANDLVLNPHWKSEADERFVLWSEMEAAMQEQRKLAEQMIGQK